MMFPVRETLMQFLLFGIFASTLPSPEQRAVTFLSREVPTWSVANKCFSCHNNGNAARALLLASRAGYDVPEKSLDDTLQWLAKPKSWDNNRGDQPFNDEALARLQFSLALLDALETGRFRDRQPLRDAVTILAARQGADGSWSIGPEEPPGSPTTLGPVLATAECRRMLASADATRYREPIRRAEAWLRCKSAKTVLDAAAILLALEKADDEAATTQRKACLEVLRRGVSSDGGWGPYINSASEVFDTGLVLLALSKQPKTDAIRAWIRQGRLYLTKTQQADGSWPETTRPTGGVSYAERLSTTGWALRALLATRPRDADGAQRRAERRTSKGT
jgi:hypothetical protein